ncbi:MAG: hypothetical protein ABSF94_19060 [Steroidobacteraceae bacterium]|jgi:hypothetical protein
MHSDTRYRGGSFYRALTAVAIGAPIVLVIAAGTLPEGFERGEFVVGGHGIALAMIVTAMILRTAYSFGFRTALRMAGEAPRYSIPAAD